MGQIADLWFSETEKPWAHALDRYWAYIKPANMQVERYVEALDVNAVKGLDAICWRDFLQNVYLPWKYTAANRLATVRRAFDRNPTEHLWRVRNRLFAFALDDVRAGVEVVAGQTGGIRGLGTAGASGLLSIFFPHKFGTVDQFLVDALRQIPGLSGQGVIAGMRKENLTASDAVELIRIMRRKAAENNRGFNTDAWTPRKIDKVLWTVGHEVSGHERTEC